MVKNLKRLSLATLAVVISGIFLTLGLIAFNSADAATKQRPAAKMTTESNKLFDGLMGGTVNLDSYRGKVVLVVNTASQCGYTGQYTGLEALWRARQRQGLVIVGVPSNDFGAQEPGSSAEIKKFCELNYGVTFPMTEKYAVHGSNAHPFFKTALAVLGPSAEPKWNFHKILIGRDGRPVAAFASRVAPESAELHQAIDAALNNH